MKSGGLARSEASAGKLAAAGFTVARGDLADATVVAEATRAVAAVVYAASPGDQSTAAVDEAAVRAIIATLRGTSQQFVYTSGCLVYGATGDTPATECSPVRAIDLER